jgi:hypothetical protein
MNNPSHMHGYNVGSIATPPPAEPQYIAVSAILFAPEEGMLLLARVISVVLTCNEFQIDLALSR